MIAGEAYGDFIYQFVEQHKPAVYSHFNFA